MATGTTRFTRRVDDNDSFTYSLTLPYSGNSGPVPDPVQILCAMIADLRKPNGALNVPGLYAKVARPSAKQLARIRKLPLSEAKFKKDAGMLPGGGSGARRSTPCSSAGGRDPPSP